MKKILFLTTVILTILLFFGFKKNDLNIIWNHEYKEYDLPEFTENGFISIRTAEGAVFPLTPSQYKTVKDTLSWAQGKYPRSKVGVQMNMGLLGRLNKRAKDLSNEHKVKLENYLETNLDSLLMKVVRKDGNKIVLL